MSNIVTRFAPSPTGFLHIGGVRTALFNWLYARGSQGTFVLRIEDTDQVRSTEESCNAILESMKWLGIDWDEGPFFQTRRTDIYENHVQQLVDSGHAYYCSCTKEEVEKMREQARAKGEKPMYNGHCRELGLKKGPDTVVRLKTPDTGVTIVKDVVKGDTTFQNAEIDDFIIQRSDGTFMYNFAVVVDDITMGINTIIRGDDHLVNTPKQMMIYEALGAELPVFGHVPMVLGSDKARLSKRHGAMSVEEYKNMGYLPWSHGDQEFFTREELIEKFDIDHLGRSAGMFDMDKLTALNAKHIQAAAPKNLASPFLSHIARENITAHDDVFTHKVIETLQPRSKTLADMAKAAVFYYLDEPVWEEKAVAKFLTPANKPLLEQSAQGLQALEDFSQEPMEEMFKAIMASTGLGFGKIAQPLRVALTGTTVSPGIFEMILAMGKEKTLDRINKAIAKIS